MGKEERQKVTHFLQIATDCTEREATNILTRNKWDVTRSLDAYFSGDGGGGRAGGGSQDFDIAEFTIFFHSLKSSRNPEVLDVEESFPKLCAAIGVEPVDPVVIAIASYCAPEDISQGFKKTEFERGMRKLGASSAEELKERLPSLRATMKANTRDAKQIYIFAFEFNLEPGKKTMPMDLAIELWRILLSDKFELHDDWVTFLKQKKRKAVTKDTWTMLYDFATTVKTDLAGYDVDGAWPILVDEFVEWKRLQLA